ncbi:MAG TPA: F0F1 ATP synthase subunit B [Longimicrobiales bacterium]|nr:F0F1 ATP synthase subunit B [Longimicrobiales bacterium]
MFAILLQHAAGAGEAEAPNVFNVDLATSVWTWVIFLALLWVLSRYAFPPILGYAAAREERIQKSLDEAKRVREDAAALLEQQRRELAEAKQEAQRVIAEGRQDAEKLRAELLERAREEQQELVAGARADIQRERERAVETVRRDAVDLALAAASKLVAERLDAERDRKIVEEFLSGAGSAPPRG